MQKLSGAVDATRKEELYKAMLLKESFLEVYEQTNVEDAEQCLKNWIRDASSNSLTAFKSLAESFLNKMPYILNWFKRRISSAISEGFNNKIISWRADFATNVFLVYSSPIDCVNKKIEPSPFPPRNSTYLPSVILRFNYFLLRLFP